MQDERHWRLEEVFPGSGSGIYQLQPATQKKTLLQRFAAKQSNREAAGKLLSTLDAIRKQGIPRSVEKKTIKRLRDEIVEIRVPNAVIRAISYNKSGENAIVLLDIERTHQGSGSMKRHIDAAKEKAKVAKLLLSSMKGE